MDPQPNPKLETTGTQAPLDQVLEAQGIRLAATPPRAAAPRPGRLVRLWRRLFR